MHDQQGGAAQLSTAIIFCFCNRQKCSCKLSPYALRQPTPSRPWQSPVFLASQVAFLTRRLPGVEVRHFFIFSLSESVARPVRVEFARSIEIHRYVLHVLIQEDAPVRLQLQSRNVERRAAAATAAAFFPRVFIACQIKRSLRRIGLTRIIVQRRRNADRG